MTPNSLFIKKQAFCPQHFPLSPHRLPVFLILDVIFRKMKISGQFWVHNWNKTMCGTWLLRLLLDVISCTKPKKADRPCLFCLTKINPIQLPLQRQKNWKKACLVLAGLPHTRRRWRASLPWHLVCRGSSGKPRLQKDHQHCSWSTKLEAHWMARLFSYSDPAGKPIRHRDI